MALTARRRAPSEGLIALGVLFMILALLANGVVEYNFGDTELLIVLAIMMGVVGRPG